MNTVRFSFNPQDRTVMPPASVEVRDVREENGGPATDLVTLRPYELDIFMGQPVDVRANPDFRLDRSQAGDYVFAPDHPSFSSANVFAGAASTTDVFQEQYRQLTGKSIHWAFPEEQLGVSPESGEWANAAYVRELSGLLFFDFEDTNTGNSGEVVSHETGHALLDALRPEWREVGLEADAFHEAFGDVVAMLMTLRSPEARARIVAETGGDLLARRNLMSEMGEELSGGSSIRSAFNRFRYQRPETLPEVGDENRLGHEAHDFARLWTGTFYEILGGLADSYRREGHSPEEALRLAGDEGWRLVVGQLENAPMGAGTHYRSLAAAMLRGDAQLNGGKRQQLLADVFTRRAILSAEEASDIFQASTPRPSSATHAVSVVLGPEFGELAGAQVRARLDGPREMALVGGPSPAEQSYAERLKQDVKTLQADGAILIPQPGSRTELKDFFRPDGRPYSAYVEWSGDGGMALKRVPMYVD